MICIEKRPLSVYKKGPHAGAVQAAPRPARGADLRAWRYATQQKHPVLWGPVPAAEAARIAGAPAGCESVLIAPAIPSGELDGGHLSLVFTARRLLGSDCSDRAQLCFRTPRSRSRLGLPNK